MDHFCGVYGLGAVILTITSRYFRQNHITLFLGGTIVGSTTEYLVSFLVEVFLQVKCWDYSTNIFHMNGRVCFLYSIFWGGLTVLLIKKWNPFLDKIIKVVRNKMSDILWKGILIFFIVFLMLDCMITYYAQDFFITRMVVKHHIEMQDFAKRKEEYERGKKNKFQEKLMNEYWNDEKMIKTFPNMRVEDKYGNIIYLDSLLPDIQPYYKKIFEKTGQ